MKKCHLLVAAGLCLRAACCQAQSTVVATVPVGYLTQTLPADAVFSREF